VLADLQALSIPHEGSGPYGVVTVSMGIASIRPDQLIPADQLIARADSALYRAKTLGRNRAQVCDEDLNTRRWTTP
jgi:diguanylate cyclase (GGDEF)-like protein